MRPSTIRLLTCGALLPVLATTGGYVWRKATSVAEVRSVKLEGSLPPSPPSRDDWPWWRGRDSRNIAGGKEIPIEWNANENVAWKVALEGRGHSSPVVRGGEAFLFAADEGKQEHFLACHDLATGERKWRTTVNSGGFMEKHAKNSHASATPIHDGERVYVSFARADKLMVAAVSLDGTVAWKTDAGPYHSAWGFASSPVLHGNRIIVVADGANERFARIQLSSNNFVAALDRLTGQVAWRVRRTDQNSCGAPLAAHIAGRDQLVIAGCHSIESYDPATGESLWTFRWPLTRTANSLAYDDTSVIATGVLGGRGTFRVKADGKGDVTATHGIWKNPSIAADVPSPLVLGGRVFIAEDTGVVSCLRLDTGKSLWKERVSKAGFVSSPAAVGGNVLLADEAGDVHVIEDADAYRELAVSGTGSPIYASPVASGDRLLIRTATDLWCIRMGGRNAK